MTNTIFIALLLLISAVVVAGLWVRRRVQHVEAALSVAQAALETPPVPPPQRFFPTVMLEDESLPTEFPQIIHVAKVGHRIWDARGCAWDRHGKHANGQPVYRRALGQGVQR